MTRLAVALAVFAGGLVAANTTDFPAVTPSVVTPGKHRPRATPTASRSARRLPLPHRVHPAVPPVKARHRPSAAPAAPTVPHGLRRGARQLLTVTMYCYTGSRNAAGKWPTVGTAAGNAWPLGTRVHVQGVGVVVIEDRSAPGATDVDLYGGTDAGCEQRAIDWGRRALYVSEVAA